MEHHRNLNGMSENQVMWAQPNYPALVEEVRKIALMSRQVDGDLALREEVSKLAEDVSVYTLTILHDKAKFLPNRIAPCTLTGGIAMLFIKDRNYAELQCINDGRVYCIMIRSGEASSTTPGKEVTGTSKKEEFEVMPPVADGATIPEFYDKMLLESARRVQEFMYTTNGKGSHDA